MRNSKNLLKIFIVILFLISQSLMVSAENFNWASWKGPNHNGISDEKDWDPEFLNRPLVENWRINVGDGYSNVSIIDNQLYTLGYSKKTKSNTLYCLEVKTGKQIWKYTYKSSKGRFLGPKSSAVIDNGLVYTFSQDGNIFCHNAINGKIVWKKDTVNVFEADKPRWEFSSSVRIYGDTLLLNVCASGIALNKKTGKVIWKSEPGQGNYATPVIFKFDKKDYAAIMGRKKLFALDLKTGEVLWSIPWEAKHSIVAADPIFVGNKLFMSSGYDIGTGAVFEFSKSKPVKLWHNTNLKTHFSTSIYINEYLYGLDGNAGKKGVLKCLDFNTSKVMWEKELGFGSFTASNGYLIFLNEKGSLFVIKATPDGYKEISSTKHILKKLCWTAPVLCRSTVYIRNNKGDLVSISAEKPKKKKKLKD